MAERGAGQRSWPLSPYEVNVSFERTNAAGEAANWFGPLTPITPLAPPEVAGRQWDYPAGYNLSTLSRPFEPITFSTLRALAGAGRYSPSSRRGLILSRFDDKTQKIVTVREECAANRQNHPAWQVESGHRA